jgi:predicted Zn-dependent protease
VGLAAAVDVGDVLSEELGRSMEVLGAAEPAPHHVALTVTDQRRVVLAARDGALWMNTDVRGRFLDVDMRVGTPELDSTHPLRGLSAFDNDTRESVRIAYTGPGELDSLRQAVWRELDGRYRDARERLVLLDANRRVRVEEENPAPDFEPREPVTAALEVPPLALDLAAWRDVVVRASELLDAEDEIYVNQVRVVGMRQERTLVDTEGADIEDGLRHLRLSLQATAIADDGDEVSLFRAVDVHGSDRLPSEAEVMQMAQQLARDIVVLRDAPRVGSYTGPVILSGRAAGVFFHEVMGHRVEGHRQKHDGEGKTFLEHIGRPVLPAWIDVYDDPNVAQLAGHDLNGHYRFDDEGVEAQRAVIVEDGLFRGFLMSRSPLSVQPHSNGHGRRSPGRAPKARMGNTIIEASKTVSEAQLRQGLIAALREQDLEYGYIVDEIDGGFTMTGRVTPNAFNVRASLTRRVWADGRPDEVVRGIDLVGTPLVAFQSILAASDHVEVFNGSCGAESGWVPVSAVAPSMLFERLEFQLKEKSSVRPPLIPKPRPDGTASTEVP